MDAMTDSPMVAGDWQTQAEWKNEEADMAQDSTETLREIKALLDAQDEAARARILAWLIDEYAAKKPTRGRAKK